MFPCEIWEIFKNTPATLLKKRLWHWCFPENFAKFLRKTFLQNSSRRLLLRSVFLYDMHDTLSCCDNLKYFSYHWQQQKRIYRSNHRRCSVRKGVIRCFACTLQLANLFQKRLFPENFPKFLRTRVLQSTPVWLVLYLRPCQRCMIEYFVVTASLLALNCFHKKDTS